MTTAGEAEDPVAGDVNGDVAGDDAGDVAGDDGEAGYGFWPLFGLVIRTPRLEIRLPREDEFGALLAVVARGIHDPATMPFMAPWTDRPSPARERESAHWWWRQRAEWAAEKWNFTGAVFVDGQPVGVQGIDAEHFATLRSVHTGSWLGLAYQGLGLGKEMRQAILHLAFAGLGAQEAHSGAFFDNAPSLATSHAVGYQPNGETLAPRRDGVARMLNLRMDRATWEKRRRDDIEIVGLEACLDMFIAGPVGPAAPAAG
jgi:RimJ/RimL family protein N-acetyltransferase